MEQKVKYPIGEQDFKELRESGNLYIDKTEYLAKIIESGNKYYFLARPRRFGKSLFLSTLQYFFEGQRNLFKGLYIDSIDWDWKPYPVLRLDLNTGMYDNPDGLDGVIRGLLEGWERKYEVEKTDLPYPQRFGRIIEAAHEQTGQPVVILVDEYDKPLVRNLRKKDGFENSRKQLAAIYSNFKSSSEHIRLVFLTGVSRFSRLSVFSDLNNLRDITFSYEYSDVCGITERELLNNFKEGISNLATTQNISYEEACRELKDNYDGYRFSEMGSEMYNPWSVLNAMQDRRIANYWNETGKPTIVAEALKDVNANLEKILNTTCSLSKLQGLDLSDLDALALLYQTGYVTIKEYDAKRKKYRLGLPNREVKEGFLYELLPYYQKHSRNKPNEIIDEMIDGFIDGEPKEAMKALQTYFAGIDYALKIENENNFHNAFFLLTNLIGLQTKAESHTSDGRIDIEITTEDYIYIIELKYDHPASEALKQIEDNHYARKYQMDNREIFLIGATFSSKTRCVEDWEIKNAKTGEMV